MNQRGGGGGEGQSIRSHGSTGPAAVCQATRRPLFHSLLAHEIKQEGEADRKQDEGWSSRAGTREMVIEEKGKGKRGMEGHDRTKK